MTGNSIIITDDFLLEPFKSFSPIKVLSHNLQALRKYPMQFQIAYSIQELIDQESSQKTPLSRDQLINSEATAKIRNLLIQPDHIFQKIVTNLQPTAAKRLKLVDDFTEKFIRDMANFTQKKIKEAESASRYNDSRDKFVADLAITAHQMTFHTMRERGHIEEYPYIFSTNISVIFAFSFTYIWRVVNWAICGGVQQATTAIRGDTFDIVYLAISSVTDGILTKDKRLNACRADLISIFKRV